MAQSVWAGVDVGKRHHHCVAMTSEGKKLLSKRVANDEAELRELIGTVSAFASGDQLTWVVDQNRGGAALLIALLLHLRHRVIYLPPRSFHHAAAALPGENKTDARDAHVIADHARTRTDLQPLQDPDDIPARLRLMTRRRTQLVDDRRKAVNRLRGELLEYFPALEAAFDYAHIQGPLLLLTMFQTPLAIREAGLDGIETALRQAGARRVERVAAEALKAAEAQTIAVHGEQIAAVFVGEIAQTILDLGTAIAEIEKTAEAVFLSHPQAEIILSMPGFGPRLGAEFLAATGGNMKMYVTADRFASVCGLAPVARDSGSTVGNHRRPLRFDRRLLRVCYLSAYRAIRDDDRSRIYYERKRSEGKTHIQAILALARRRSNVLWALLRDNHLYQPIQASEPRTQVHVGPGKREAIRGQQTSVTR